MLKWENWKHAHFCFQPTHKCKECLCLPPHPVVGCTQKEEHFVWRKPKQTLPAHRTLTSKAQAGQNIHTHFFDKVHAQRWTQSETQQICNGAHCIFSHFSWEIFAFFPTWRSAWSACLPTPIAFSHKIKQRLKVCSDMLFSSLEKFAASDHTLIFKK